MTGLGVAIAFFCFIITSIYLCKKYKLQFWNLFYWVPFAAIFTYLLGSYVNFMLSTGLIPTSGAERRLLVSPYGYSLHFVGLAIGSLVSFWWFLRQTKRVENKKLYVDVLFFCTAISLIPLGIFLLLWDNFIGIQTNSIWGVKALHTDSQLNRFSAVYPIGLFLSIGALLTTIGIWLWKKIVGKTGVGLWGFIILLVVINITLVLQQYPRYGVVRMWDIVLDIKQYVSFLIALLCLYIYDKWDNKK